MEGFLGFHTRDLCQVCAEMRMSMDRIPQQGEVYRHFKGNLYRIVTVAQHTERDETLVVYKELDGERVYARPLAMFIGEVDHDKYPAAAGKWRFTLADGRAGDSVPLQSVTQQPLQDTQNLPQPLPSRQLPAQQEGTPGSDPGFGTELDPKLLAFLDADSYEQKLEIYASMAGKADASMLNIIAASMDLELSGDTVEEQYEALKNCLVTLEHFECNRLR